MTARQKHTENPKMGEKELNEKGGKGEAENLIKGKS